MGWERQVPLVRTTRVLEFNCHYSVRDVVDSGCKVGGLIKITPLSLALASHSVDEDDRVALTKGVVHTFLEAALVLRQPHVRLNTITGVEVVRDADDVCG